MEIFHVSKNFPAEERYSLTDQIRRLLALPIERRTNFLRKRIGFCASCL